MKKILIFSILPLVFAAGALDLEVKPLRVNGLKNAVVNGAAMRGTMVPGGSIDFPLPAKEIDLSKFTRAVLTLAPAEGGILPVSEDLRLNLRAANSKIQLETSGMPGEKPNETVFRLTGAPEKTFLVRLYLDEIRRYTGKEIALTAVSLRFDDGETDVFLPIFRARVNNCKNIVKENRIFGGTPLNEGAAVVIEFSNFYRTGTFRKAELDLDIQEGALLPKNLELNPRGKSGEASAKAVEKAPGKYLFTFDRPLTDSSAFFLYFNRGNTLKDKPVRFLIKSIRLIK
ncbi:MAG: hypothetical protein IJS01_00845 [Lentisphaeria bacterium]|nr:hypothetical protein [Lentisphaeria bacterium]